jgi:hypothetical protein
MKTCSLLLFAMSLSLSAVRGEGIASHTEITTENAKSLPYHFLSLKRTSVAGIATIQFSITPDADHPWSGECRVVIYDVTGDQILFKTFPAIRKQGDRYEFSFSVADHLLKNSVVNYDLGEGNNLRVHSFRISKGQMDSLPTS